MTIELILFGLITGFTSGFFGIGGGMVLVPLLLYAGYDMKESVAISIMQMVFSSIFGSFLNLRKQKHLIVDGLLVGIGGFTGGLFSGSIIATLSSQTLQYMFILILIASILKIFKTPVDHEDEIKRPNKLFLILIGMGIGAFAMSIGVGGTIMLTPLLVGFMRYQLKIATTLSLFFVVFSSIAGFISLSLSNQMLYNEGVIVGFGSLIGVYFGIKVKNMVHIKSYKNAVLILFTIILIFMIKKAVWG